MKIGANSVLFGGYDVETAFKYMAIAGYDGIELSAIEGMGRHLNPTDWQRLVPKIKQLSNDFDLELLAIEQPSQELQVMEQTFQAAAELGIPVVNCGPGGRTGDEDSFQKHIEQLDKLARMAERYGVSLCVKAHVGACIHDTPTTLRAMVAISSPAFGIDMDPSHIYRAGEDPTSALSAVISRIKHIHIRDCKGRQQGPGRPEDQINGRGDIDLIGFIQTLNKHNYKGPVNLEIIGATNYSLQQRCMIAAEARGHMQACLQVCHAV